MVPIPIDTDQIVVTASRVPADQSATAASVTVIEEDQLRRLGEPQIAQLLRLVPSAAVSTSGPMGSITEVRIRGAEANHTLLFIDGIRANDPAESNAPRFELLNADIASRIEVVRGPQSALWGSEAIGGVIAVEGAASDGSSMFAEAGSHGFKRAAARWGIGDDAVQVSLGGAIHGSRGINNYAGVDDGERDGFSNLALRGRVAWKPRDGVELGVNGFALGGRNDFDGYDPVTFNRADTLDESSRRLAAGRIWIGRDMRHWSLRASASRLWSSNRNELDGAALNKTRARRDSASVQAETVFTTGKVQHQLIAAAELDKEVFRARDFTGGFTNQDRSRNHLGITGEWRAQIPGLLVTDLAIRRDQFNRFGDATSLRASALLKPGTPLELGISYAEGIAQPTFTELYGFFPGGFTGNPALKPEQSRGFEFTARFRTNRLVAAFAAYHQRLRDEILTVFTPVNTAVNSQAASTRRGAEVELLWRASRAVQLGVTYAYLDASQAEARELRRPRHSGSIALRGGLGRWDYGGSIAFTGSQRDQRDEFPYDLVRLNSYWLAAARVGYAARPGVELFVRVANAFDANYQDVVGYRTEGRSLHAGIRLGARP